ncbi:hypothetical protein D3C71_1546350 [compost metagenome]
MALALVVVRFDLGKLLALGGLGLVEARDFRLMVASRLGQCGSMLLGSSRNQLAQAGRRLNLRRAWGVAWCEFLRRLEGFEIRRRPQRVEVDPVIQR